MKRILKYIKRTIDYGLRYHSSVKLNLNGYSDADYAGDKETRRSTSEHVNMFNGSVLGLSVAVLNDKNQSLCQQQLLLKELTGQEAQTIFFAQFG